MKLYTSTRAPNPRRVDVYLAEKGIEIERQEVPIMKLAHKTDDYAAINPMQRVPVLELGDGTHISETIAICRYFEELNPEPPLFGTDTVDRAVVEMWQRRMEFNLFIQIAQAFRHLHPAMAELEVPQVSEWGEVNKPRVVEVLEIMDRELAGRAHVAGENFTIADITAICGIDFLKLARIEIPDGLDSLRRWAESVHARPSVANNA